MHHTLSAELFQSARIKENFVTNAALVLAGSVLLVVSARLAVYLPFSPVPVTAQTLVVLLCGAVLGSKLGTFSVCLYIVKGIIGLPVFAGGRGGLAALAGPTGGYLAGFIAAAYLVGWLAERGFDRRRHLTLFAFGIGQTVIYLLGVLRLSTFTGVGEAVRMGVIPFLLGDAFKMACAVLLLPSLWKVVQQKRTSRD